MESLPDDAVEEALLGLGERVTGLAFGVRLMYEDARRLVVGVFEEETVVVVVVVVVLGP